MTNNLFDLIVPDKKNPKNNKYLQPLCLLENTRAGYEIIRLSELHKEREV